MVSVSVIVAVYQAEKYIQRCLDSLKRQSLQDFEVLLIDDGSRDKSRNICEEYAAKDNRFRFFHKENGGVATARQMGLDNARGEFVIHVDPDDWVDSSMLEELLNKALADSADVVICDYYVDNGKCKNIIKQEPSKLKHESVFYDLANGKLHGSCCNKLVRTACFQKYNIEFLKDVIFCEDLLVNLKLAEKPIKFSYLPRAFYHYYQAEKHVSAVHHYSIKRLLSLQTIVSWLEQKNDSAIKIGIEKLKKNAKWTAFFIKEFNNTEFKNLYPDVNSTFRINLSSLGHWDFFVTIALLISLPFARALFQVKVFVTTLWRR